MGRPCSAKKGELLVRAYGILEIAERDVFNEPSITPHLRRMGAQMRKMRDPRHPASKLPTSPYYYLAAAEAPEARLILEQVQKLIPYLRKLVPIEAYCVAAKVSSWRILEIVTSICVRMGAQSSAMVMSSMAPAVVAETVRRALEDGTDGLGDRTNVLKATGVLPTPKGTHTSITITQNAAQVSAGPSAAPPPEQTIRRLVERFNKHTLPPAEATPLPVFAQTEQAESIEVSADEED